MLTWEEFLKTREYIEKKALQLMDQDNKSVITAGVPIDNYTKYIIGDRIFYGIKANVFKVIIERHLIAAQKKFPKKFGTGNAKDVLKALYEIEPVFEFERYIEFLRNEQFVYLIEVKDSEIIDRILRLDLFRQIDLKTGGTYDFTGGLFHAFKHFSVNDVNLSTGNDNHNIWHPEHLIQYIAQAFFIENGKYESPTKYVTQIKLDPKYSLKFVFYLEKNTNVFFINTIHKTRI